MKKNITQEIQEAKELLYLNSLKVANNTLAEAEEQGYEVSSGVLSASASLLKLKLEDVVVVDDTKNIMADMVKSIMNKD